MCLQNNLQLALNILMDGYRLAVSEQVEFLTDKGHNCQVLAAVDRHLYHGQHYHTLVSGCGFRRNVLAPSLGLLLHLYWHATCKFVFTGALFVYALKETTSNCIDF